MINLLILLAFVVLASANNVTFDKCKVFRITPETETHLALLRQIDVSDEYSYWIYPSFVNRTVDLMVTPSEIDTFEEIMKVNNIPYKTYIEDVQHLIDNESYGMSYRRRRKYSFDRYYKLHEIYAQLELLEKRYPDNVQVVIIGRTYENRKIKGVRVKFGENKPVAVIEAGMHAREWIAPATAMFILHKLLFSKNEDIRAMAESCEWYILPTVNPDGYVYSHEKNRLWRKTRTRYGNCYGTDPNRNWNHKWKLRDASNRPCSETFAGNGPFSEIETKTYAKFLISLKDRMFAFIALHSYSQILLVPYGYTTEHLDNYDELFEIGNATINALRQKYGTEYKIGNVAEILYEATGSSMDWVKGVLKVPIVYTYELRDQGDYGFILPVEQIRPTGTEVMDSLVVLFSEAKKYGYPNINLLTND